MKYIPAAIFIFLITLALTFQTTANEHEAICTANEHTKCGPQSEHKDHSAEMNSLFPEKQKLTRFTVRPSMVELNSPKFLAKISGPAKLDWKEAKGANAYHLQIATDPNFKWLVVNETSIKTTSFDFTAAEANTRYFWRVAAFNTENDSMFTKSNFVSSAFITK